MSKPKLTLVKQNNLFNNGKQYIKQNAFIKPNGDFYLAKGYTGCNPWHQLESSALWVGRQDIGYDFVEKYNEFINKLKLNYKEYKNYLEALDKVSSVEFATEVYDKRSILVHFYGYVLFCRTELVKTYKDDGTFYENSLVPNPNLYGKEATLEQINTLEKLFNINDGQDVSTTWHCKHISGKDEMLKLVFEHERYRWHN